MKKTIAVCTVLLCAQLWSSQADIVHGADNTEKPKSIILQLHKRPTSKKPLSSGKYDNYYPRQSRFDEMLFNVNQHLKSIMLGVPETIVDLTNSNNYAYYVNIYLGSARQPFNVHFDTGSNKLVIMDMSCTNCHQTRFDTTTSSSFQASTTADSIYYQDGSGVQGFKVRDTVSFDASGTFAATGFNFLLATTQSGFSDEDGLIGMSRPIANTPYHMMMDSLRGQGKVSSRVFSVYMADRSETSNLQIGDYDPSYIKYGAPMKYVPLVEDNIFWDVAIRAVRIGTSDTSSIGSPAAWRFATPEKGVLDTGTSVLLIPQKLYQRFMDVLMIGTSSFIQDGVYVARCDLSLYNSIYLYIDNTWFEIPPQAYVLSLQGQSTWCQISLGSNSYDMWLLGDAFLMNYLSVWDHDNARVGLVPHITSAAEVPMKTLSNMPLPTLYFEQTSSWDNFVQSLELIAALVGAVGLLSAIFVALLVFLYENHIIQLSPSLLSTLLTTEQKSVFKQTFI